MKKFYAEIRQYCIPDTDPPVKRVECDNERKASKLCDAWDINLNHNEYYTQLVSEE